MGKLGISSSITFALLGHVSGALSLAALLQAGFSWGWVRPVEFLIRWYERLLEVLLSWAEPMIIALLRALPYDLELSEHWRHVLVGYVALFVPIYRPYILRREWFVVTVAMLFLAWVVAANAVIPEGAPGTDEAEKAKLIIVVFVIGGAVAVISYVWQFVSSRRSNPPKGLVAERMDRALSELVLIRNGFIPAYTFLAFAVLNAGLSRYGL
jgi:hypothetical protein